MVRFALSSDASGLAQLRWLSREVYERQSESLASFTPRFSAWLAEALTSGSWFAAVATSETGALLGCMFLQRVATVPVPGLASRHWGYVTHAFVHEASRNRGLGQGMLALLIHKARELRLHELHVWPSTAAISLYTRVGFLSPEQQRANVPSDEPSYVLPLALARSVSVA